MNPFEDIELQDCPCCHGAGIIEEEGGWCLYVQCLDCGRPTAMRRSARTPPAGWPATGTWARLSSRAPETEPYHFAQGWPLECWQYYLN